MNELGSTSYPEQTPPQRQGCTPQSVIILCGSSCIVVIIGIIILGSFLAHAAKDLPRLLKEGKQPSPSSYVGNWENKTGTKLFISSDGTAGYRIVDKSGFTSKSEHMNGVGIVVNENVKTLTIGLLGLKHIWKIDSPPHSSARGQVMTLDAGEFRRVSDYSEETSKSATE